MGAVHLQTMKHLIIAILTLLLVGCFESNQSNEVKPIEWKEIPLAYAKGFKVFEHDSLHMIQVLDPDNHQLLHEVIVSPTMIDIDNQKKVLGNGIVSFASSHTGAMVLLDALDRMKGVSYKKYVYNEKVRALIDSGAFSEFGELAQLNVEELVNQEVDLLFSSSRVNELKHHEVLNKSNIGMLSVFEWREMHPLGRAEWIKFYGYLLRKSEKANQIFEDSKKAYDLVKSETKNSDKRVLMGNDYKGTWYMPGGNSFMAVFLKDVGANYFWFNDSTTGSIPLNIEVVIENHLDDEIWINPGMARTLEELSMTNHQYTSFNAFQKGEVYNYIKRVREDGGNDFWEAGIYQPHHILKDYQILFYNQSLKDLHFYQKLQ